VIAVVAVCRRSDLHFVCKFSTYRFITCSRGGREVGNVHRHRPLSLWRNRDVQIVTHAAATWLLSFSITWDFWRPLISAPEIGCRSQEPIIDPPIKSDDYYVTGIEPINVGVRSGRCSLWNETSRVRNKGRCLPEILRTGARVMSFRDVILVSFFFYDLSASACECETFMNILSK